MGEAMKLAPANLIKSLFGKYYKLLPKKNQEEISDEIFEAQPPEPLMTNENIRKHSLILAIPETVDRGVIMARHTDPATGIVLPYIQVVCRSREDVEQVARDWMSDLRGYIREEYEPITEVNVLRKVVGDAQNNQG